MKRYQKGLAISMAIAFMLTSTALTTVMANGDNNFGIQIAKADKADKGNSKGQQNKQSLETEKALKQQMKQKKAEIKAAIKAGYSKEELDKIKLAGDKIKKNNKDITVLPVENIIIKGVNVKFDTPPVIKSGRTLIPVKALSEAFGAKVTWVAAEKMVIISKGDTKIILVLDSNKIIVNGVESTLDVPACSLNGRTVVPMKFIVEKLGLKVNWNSEDKDIEIEGPAGDTTQTTTGSAIQVPTGSAIEVPTGSAVTIQP